jgi:hypothetical protein
MILLGTEPVPQAPAASVPFAPPPPVAAIGDRLVTLDDVLARTSTVVADFSFRTLASLVPSAAAADCGTTDEAFL